MAAANGRRASALLSAALAGIALIVSAAPALAQVPPGTQAAAVAGGPTAVCPPGSPGAVVAGGGTFGAITVTGGGRCTPLAADASGSYSVGGSGSFPFQSSCSNPNGVVAHNGAVQVPAGTIVNGVAVATTTTVTTLNTPVTFPGGQTAILNQVITTPTSVTRNAIVFTNGPIVGQVICGAAAYPLSLDSGGETAAPPLSSDALSSSDGGPSAGMLLLAGGIAIALLAQVVVGRRLWRRRGTTPA